MKKTLPLVFVCFALAGGVSCAASLMLDFGATAVASPYLTLSPGHNAGTVAGSETSWNIISSMTPPPLVYGDGSAAAGITLTLGQESTGGDNVIDFSTAVSNLALAGNGGGTAGRQNLLTPGSIYGDNGDSTAVGRDGIFGGGNAGTTGAAIGLRIDGLAEGSYLVYVMARNTNSNTASLPMNVFAHASAASATFDFSLLTAYTQANIGYPSGVDYAGEYGSFINGENYVGIPVSIGAGDSLFLAVDGSPDGSDRRGFLNMVQVVQVPEPSAALLGALGALALIRRRR